MRDGKPYCNRCYGALFGPRGYGHGGVESHTFHHGQTGKVRTLAALREKLEVNRRAGAVNP
ncbi:unnamed protein product [Heligmosomoides polygyrus]|uniref:LIM zinc-binding domain-containing protein n=1 Tax=Heligmosomoides polygyrus TaxID=6339 RepID=A0A3P7XV57_HELPZ|nr:unnamed protein product [Heligmosomoides polygyrus]